MHRRRFATLAHLIILVAAAVRHASAADETVSQVANATTPLLAPALEHASDGMRLEDNVLRHRVVRIEPSVFGRLAQSPPQAVHLNLFDDAGMMVVISEEFQRSTSSFTWIGSLVGEDTSHVMITVEDDVVLANVSSPRLGRYQLRYLGDGLHLATQVAAMDVPLCGVDSLEAALPHPRPGRRAEATLARGAGPCVEDGAFIDVLFAYTTQAQLAAGGTTAIEAMINMAVDEANVAFANSSIPTTVRIAGTEEVTYVEPGYSDQDLDRLMQPADGYLDELHASRDATHADIVSLILDSTDVCGRAYVSVGPGNTPVPQWGFQLVKLSCLTGNNVFAHELGHNLGCLHDVATDPCDAGAYFHGKGHVDPAGMFTTIMAYGASEIPYFSNPNVLYDGVPTGVAAGQPGESDCAGTILQTAFTVANFRSLDCNGNGMCDDQDIILGTSQDCDGNGTPDECDPDVNRNGVPDACDISGGGSADTNGDGIPDESQPPVLFVDASATGLDLGTSWPDAYSDLQDALAVAAASTPGAVQEIWVAAGTYLPWPTGERARTFRMVDGVSIYGGFAGGETALEQRDVVANPTILSGDFHGDDGLDFTNRQENAITVLTGSYADPTAVIDGFTISGGNADPDFSGCWFSPYNAGGGIRVFNGSPTIRNCVVTDNETTGRGGGIYVVHTGNPVFEGCTVLKNRTTLSRFDSTGGSGGGVSLSPGGSGSVRMIDCDILDNTAKYGAGILDICQDCQYIDCTFAGNTATGNGGGMNVSGAFDSDPLFLNCVFTGNTASVGAAVYGAGANAIKSPRLVNCSVVGNHATFIGGVSASYAIIQNSVLWGNTHNSAGIEGAQLIDYGAAQANYSCIQGWTGAIAGVGSMGDDPLLVDLDGADDVLGTLDDNVRLSAGSPAIDAGDNTVAELAGVTTDADGDVRFLDDPNKSDTGVGPAPIVDMGAYEFAGGPPPSCIGDANLDGEVDTDDFLEVLGGWGACPVPCPPSCSGDLNGDCLVDTDDFLVVLVKWGACPGQ